MNIMDKVHNTTPECVGFIMDGNRRWAKQHGLGTQEGHARGFDTLKKVIATVYDAHIKHLVCYAFSTENWSREPNEVNYLMELFSGALREAPHKLVGERNVHIRFIGERTRFSAEFQEAMGRVEKETEAYEQLTVWIALSYGGRAEIVHAVQSAIEHGEKIDENSFKKFLWTADMPDPDLIIRTGGEKRLSNFLLWQSAYSELFFTKTFWPDFGEAEFQSILEEYGTRKRRRGT
jgi:undecaprenyl diphosphate synthase